RDRERLFNFDRVFWSVDPKSDDFASQEMVYGDLGAEVLASATEGYNACVFAYGPTGSGKTYTMMGLPGDEGLIPRICEGLFDRMKQVREVEFEEEIFSFEVSVSYFEIYNEKVRDLLPADDETKRDEKCSLKVREHPKDGPYVQGLKQRIVRDKQGVQELIDKGTENRTTAATHMHDRSSRSHAIFTINFTQAKLDEDLPSEIVSKINLVDLAGSERADPTTNYHRGRLKEGANINKSLVALGNVIQALGSPQGQERSTSVKTKALFIPYRDSVLTWLLKDSLGGNARTIMIATISPSSLRYNETINTLRYARRAKNIVNRPCVNEDPNVSLIRELRAEIVRLRGMLSSHWGSTMSLSDSSSNVVEKLEEHENMVCELTKTFFGKWQDSQFGLMQPLRAFDRSQSLGVIVDTQLPHLLCMDDDILSTGIMLYYLQEGTTSIGTEDAALPQDIVLSGSDVAAEHCYIEHDVRGDVTLYPCTDGAPITVNDRDVALPVRLSQGDILHLGKGNMFRFNHPQEAAKLRERRRVRNHGNRAIIPSPHTGNCFMYFFNVNYVHLET
ncbi:hypothetical protein CAPTEDRAFT_105632, partial [Capitella teleta]